MTTSACSSWRRCVWPRALTLNVSKLRHTGGKMKRLSNRCLAKSTTVTNPVQFNHSDYPGRPTLYMKLSKNFLTDKVNTTAIWSATIEFSALNNTLPIKAKELHIIIGEFSLRCAPEPQTSRCMHSKVIIWHCRRCSDPQMIDQSFVNAFQAVNSDKAT